MSELLSIQSVEVHFFLSQSCSLFCFTSLVAASHYLRLPMVYNMCDFDNLFLPGMCICADIKHQFFLFKYFGQKFTEICELDELCKRCHDTCHKIFLFRSFKLNEIMKFFPQFW